MREWSLTRTGPAGFFIVTISIVGDEPTAMERIVARREMIEFMYWTNLACKKDPK